MTVARSLGEVLRLIMEDRGWSQDRLAGELEEVSQKWVSDIVRGKRDCPLNKVVRLLTKVGWELRITPKSDRGESEDEPVRRRSFVVGTASALLIKSPKTTPFQDPAYVEALTERAVRAHYQMGGNSLVTTLLRQARKVHLASTDGGGGLQSAVSDYMRWGAYILRAAGHPELAARFANSAIRHAGEADDPDRQAMAYFALIIADTFNANAFGSMSITSRNAGQAVTRAQQALNISGIGDESRAYLKAALACGLANVPGHEPQTRRVITESLSIDTIPAVDRADVIGMSGNALRDIGERREAFKVLEDAAFQSAPFSQFQQAEFLCDQIMVALDMRKAEQAASLISDLSYVIPLVDSAVIDKLTDNVIRTAKSWEAVSDIRDAREKLQSVRLTEVHREGW